MAKLIELPFEMPLPLTVSCFNKIQIGFICLVPAHPDSPGQNPEIRKTIVAGCMFFARFNQPVGLLCANLLEN